MKLGCTLLMLPAAMARAGTIVQQTRKTYDGPLVLGEDLMQFDISETVTMSRIPASRNP